MKRKRKRSNRNKIPDDATGDDPELAAVDEMKQKLLEERVREALAEPAEPTTSEEFQRRMDRAREGRLLSQGIPSKALAVSA